MDFTKRLVLWRLRQFAFDIDVTNRDGAKHQDAESLSKLTTTDRNEKPLRDDSPLHAIEKLDNVHASLHAFKHDEDCKRSSASSNFSDDEAEYASTTYLLMI